MTRILGIDPGADGALVLLDGLEVLQSWDFPWTKGIGADPAMLAGIVLHVQAQWGRSTAPIEVVVEASSYNVGASGGSGARTAYLTGHTLGVLQGVLAGMRVPYRLVAALAWQKGLGLSEPRGLAPTKPASDATEEQRKAYRKAVADRRLEARKAGQGRQAAYVRARVPGLDLTPGRRKKDHTGLVAACCVALWGAR
jgi:hypothetical protein